MNKIFLWLDSKLTVRIPFILFIFFPLFAYLSWEIYWFRHVGLGFIKWHTHLMPYVCMGILWLFIFKIIHKRKAWLGAENVFLLTTSILFSLFLIEFFFIVTGIEKTYMEKVSGSYVGPFTSMDRNYYHVWVTPNGEHWLTKPEYSFWRPNNSLGFADVEWTRAKRTGTKRILALGDSFTEGDGAPYDSNYVELFRNILKSLNDSSEVLNAGICGSDPFNNYMNLKDLLLPYKPDVIIQSLSSYDLISDIRIRGGMERFKKDGTVKFRPGPWWEPVYAISYLSRLVFNSMDYNQELLKNNLSAEEVDRITKETIDLFIKFDNLCKKNGIKLIIVLHPGKGEVIDNRYDYDFSNIFGNQSPINNIKVLDLLPCYQAYIKENRTNPLQYFWTLDGHHNSAGYRMMAETTFENIYPLIKDSIIR